MVSRAAAGPGYAAQVERQPPPACAGSLAQRRARSEQDSSALPQSAAADVSEKAAASLALSVR